MTSIGDALANLADEMIANGLKINGKEIIRQEQEALARRIEVTLQPERMNLGGDRGGATKDQGQEMAGRQERPTPG